VPTPNGIPQRRHGRGAVSFGEKHNPAHPAGSCRQRVRAEERRQRGQLSGGVARGLNLSCCHGQLDEGREESRALDASGWNIGERAVELTEADARPPLGKPEQCQAGLRFCTGFQRAAEGLSCSGEVPLAEPELP